MCNGCYPYSPPPSAIPIWRAAVCLAVGHGKHCLHFRPRQPTNRWRHGFLRRDGPDMAAPFDMGRIPAGDKASECSNRGKPLIAGPGGTAAILFEMCEEL